MLVDLIVAADKIAELVIRPETLKEVPIPPDLKRLLEHATKANVGEYSGTINTSGDNVAIFPNQYFRLAVELFDFAQELKKYFDYLDKVRDLSVPYFSSALAANKSAIINAINNAPSAKAVFASTSDIEKFAAFIEDVKNCPARLKAKTFINRDATTKEMSFRPVKDCFGSVILAVVNTPNASAAVLGDMVYGLTLNPDIYQKLKLFYQAKSSLTLDSPRINPDDRIDVPKPFLLLAGISGTGKSRFVREQASCSSGSDNFLLIPVRPDWHEPSDLLGYVSRLGGSPTYVPTSFLGFIVKAWKAAFESFVDDNLTLKPLDEIPTFWVCLDEMNLAPVEQYFADYLSIIETRNWEKDKYSCDPLLKPFELLKGDARALDEFKTLLELDGSSQLWSYFETFGIPLPPNMIVAGTVNMDETTHGFSRKVIDRALTIDFGNFFPNDFEKYFDGQNKPRALSYSRYSKASLAELSSLVSIDPDGTKSTAFLNAVNHVLLQSPFELAFRAQNELLVSLLCFKPKNKSELLAVWDDFLMCKLLPRLDGDEDKFRKSDGTNLLDELLTLIDIQFVSGETSNKRIDLLSKTWDDKEIYIGFRSPAKLRWMKDRLSGGFTSFWP